mgnify:FL=1
MLEELKKEIQKVLEIMGVGDLPIVFEHPDEISNGDYATPIALAAGKKLGENPKEIAEKIVTHLADCVPEGIEKIEVAGIGFINVYFSKEFFTNSVKEILSEKEHFGKNKSQKGKTVMIEYTQPNVLKSLHIGHLMSNIILERRQGWGNSLA